MLKPATMHFCRPGTGIFNVALPGDVMPRNTATAQPWAAVGTAAGPWPGYHPVPVGRRCNWTAPVATNIPDSKSRACAAPLPTGQLFLIGAQIPRGRDPVCASQKGCVCARREGCLFFVSWFLGSKHLIYKTKLSQPDRCEDHSPCRLECVGYHEIHHLLRSASKCTYLDGVKHGASTLTHGRHMRGRDRWCSRSRRTDLTGRRPTQSGFALLKSVL